jgi:hypothetical protein
MKIRTDIKRGCGYRKIGGLYLISLVGVKIFLKFFIFYLTK